MYQVITQSTYFTFVREFQTEKEARRCFAGLYNHALDNYGDGTVLSLYSPGGSLMDRECFF